MPARPSSPRSTARSGTAYVALGPPGEAREHLVKALELAKAADAPALAAALLNNLGNLDASKEAYADAARAYAEAAALAAKAGDPALAARALANQAQAAERAGAPAGEVRAALGRAITVADGLPDSHAKTSVLISAGRTYARLRDLEPAHACLRRAQAVAEATGDARAQSYALGYLGALYEERERLDEALALSRQALFLAQHANAPESLYRWHWQVGHILATKGARAEAIPSYQQAVQVLSGIRFDMAHGYATGGGSFRDAVGPVFFELVDLLLATAPAPADAAAYQARLHEAREMLEKLKAAELRDWNTNRGEPSPRTLASVGVGLRTFYKHLLRGEIYWGHRLKSIGELGDGGLQDDGVTFALVASF